MNRKEVSNLYDRLISSGYSADKLGDIDLFEYRLSDPQRRKVFYDFMSKKKDFDIGGYDEYEQRLAGNDSTASVVKGVDNKVHYPNVETRTDTAMSYSPNVDYYNKVADTSGVYKPEPNPYANLQPKPTMALKPEGSVNPVVADTTNADESLKDNGVSYLNASDKIRKELSGSGRMSEDEINTAVSETIKRGRERENNAIIGDVRKMKFDTRQDVYNYFSDKFGQSEEGKVVLREIDEKINDIKKRYTDAFGLDMIDDDNIKSKMQELQEAVSGGEITPEEAETAIDKLFEEQYGAKVEEEMSVINAQYGKALQDRFGGELSKAISWQGLPAQKKNFDSIREREAKYRGKMAITRSESDAFMPEESQLYQKQFRQGSDASIMNAVDALNRQTSKVLTEAEKEHGIDDRYMLTKVGKGILDGATSADWLYGIIDAQQQYEINSVVKKRNANKPLTESEQLLFDSYVQNAAANGQLSGDFDMSYNSGITTGQSLPFTMQFMTNPVSGIGEGIAASILKGTTKSIAKRVGARLVGDAVAAAGMTATSSAGTVAAETMRNMLGSPMTDIVGDNVVFEGFDSPMSFSKALGEALASQYIENQSEMVFESVGGLNHALGYVGNKVMPKKAVLKAGAMLDHALGTHSPKPLLIAAANSKPYSAVKHWREVCKNNPLVTAAAKKAHFGGIFEEYAEEVYGNIINSARGAQSWEDTFDVDKNIETFAGLAPMSVAFGMYGLGSWGLQQANALRYRRKAYSFLDEDGKAKYKYMDDMTNKGMVSADEIKQQLRAVLNDNTLGKQEKANEVKYLFTVAVDKESKDGKEKDKIEAKAMQAKLDGERIDPQERGARKSALSSGANILNQRVGNKKAAEDFAKAMDQNNGDVIEALAEMSERGYNSRQMNAFANYATLYNGYQGVIEGEQKETEDAVANAKAQLMQYANRGTNRIISAQTKTGQVVFVTSGNVVTDEFSSIDKDNSDSQVIVTDPKSGKITMMEPSELFNIISDEDLDSQLIESENSIRQAKENNVVEVGNPIKYTDANGNVQYGTVIQNGNTGLLGIADANGQVVSDGMQNEDIKAVNEAAEYREGEQIAAEAMDVDNAEVLNPQTYKRDDAVVLKDGNGNEVSGTISEDADDDNKLTITMDDEFNGERVLYLTAEELDGMAVSHNGEMIEREAEVDDNATEVAVEPDANVATTTAPTDVVPISVSTTTDNTAPTDVAQPQQPQQSALERIPRDEDNNPIYEATDSDTAWDAIVEEANGDEDTAQKVIEETVSDKEKALKAKQNAKSKGGKTISEKIKAENERKKAIADAQAELDIWNNIASVRKSRAEKAKADAIAQAKADAEAKAKEEAQAQAQALAEEQARAQAEADAQAQAEEEAKDKAQAEAENAPIETTTETVGTPLDNTTETSTEPVGNTIEPMREGESTPIEEPIQEEAQSQEGETTETTEMPSSEAEPDTESTGKQEEEEESNAYVGASQEYQGIYINNKGDNNAFAYVMQSGNDILIVYAVNGGSPMGDKEMSVEQFKEKLNRGELTRMPKIRDKNKDEKLYEYLAKASKAVNKLRAMKARAKEDTSKPEEENKPKEVHPDFPSNIKKAIEMLAKKAGIKVVYAVMPKGMNGSYSNDVLTINVNSASPLGFIAGHELTHAIRKASESAYQRLKNAVIESYKASGRDVDAEIEKKLNLYRNFFYNQKKNELLAEGKSEDFAEAMAIAFAAKKVSVDYVTEEVVCDEAGRMVEDGATTIIDHIKANENLSTFEKIKNGIVEVLKSIRDVFDNSSAQYKAYNNAINAWESAYKEMVDANERKERTKRTETVEEVAQRIADEENAKAKAKVEGKPKAKAKAKVEGKPKAKAKGKKASKVRKMAEFVAENVIKPISVSISDFVVKDKKDIYYITALVDVFHDKNTNYAVASDSKILIATKSEYDDSKAQTREEFKYPNWEQVIPNKETLRKNFKKVNVDLDYLLKVCSALSSLKVNNAMNVLVKIGGNAFNISRITKCLAAAKKYGATNIYVSSDESKVKALYIESEDKSTEIFGLAENRARYIEKGDGTSETEEYKTEGIGGILYDADTDTFLKDEISEYEYYFNDIKQKGKLFDFLKEVYMGEDAKYSLSDEEQSIIDNAKADGTYMKAPNGNPSNLNGKQWAQVRTNAFKDWFGDWENDPKSASKVVDENGEPMVVYHGTQEDFNVFKTSSETQVRNIDDEAPSSAFLFTDNIGGASYYGDTKDVFLSSKKLLDVRGKDKVIGIIQDMYDEVSDISPNENYSDAEEAVEDLSDYISEDGRLFYNYNEDSDINERKGKWWIIQTLIENYARENGYDSFVFNDYTRDTEHDSYGVFKPNQVKSSTDNNGEFSKGNDDIRFSLSSDVEETKDLIAVHNIKSSKLLDLLELGGMPIPSIAITKSEMGHTQFGDVSFVFAKDTIDPSKNKGNDVYDRDAWTQTFPQIHYELNDKKVASIIEMLSKSAPYGKITGHLGDVYNFEEYLNNNGLEELKAKQEFHSAYANDKTDLNYDEWFAYVTDGMIKNSGIRKQNVDPYTWDGKRKSFKQTHMLVTAENIVKYMLKQPDKGGGFGTSFFGASARKYNSIDDIKNDSNRLGAEDREKGKELIKEMEEVIKQLIPKGESGFMHFEIEKDITEAISKSSKANSIYNSLVKYYPETMTKDIAQEIESIVKQIQALSTDYFEAKPKRVVGFNEVALAIVPSNLSEAIKRKMRYSGIRNIKEYEEGNEESRINVLNENSEDIRFSLSDKAYEDAVKSGDIEEAQSMVDDAARKAGYTYNAYHGTINGRFTVFDRSKAKGSVSNKKVNAFMFSSSSRVADTYRSREDKGFYMPNDYKVTVGESLKIGTPMKYRNIPEVKGRVANNEINRFSDLGVIPKKYIEKDYVVHIFGRNFHVGDSQEKVDAFIDRLKKQSEIPFNENEVRLDVLLKMDNPIVVNMDGKTWVHMADELGKQHGELSKFINKYNDEDGNDEFDIDYESLFGETDYDGVIYKDIVDVARNGYNGDDYVVPNSEQIKSAEAVTYDDNGKLIPLSKRFNQDEKDIRFSLSDPSASGDSIVKFAEKFGRKVTSEEFDKANGEDIRYSISYEANSADLTNDEKIVLGAEMAMLGDKGIEVHVASKEDAKDAQKSNDASMAYLSKDAYQNKAEWAAKRNAKNKLVDTLTDEQHDALASLASVRHNVHSNIDRIVKNGEGLDELIKVNDELVASGLPKIQSIPTGYGEDYIDIDSFDSLDEMGDAPDKDSDEYQEWYDENYERIYEEIENLNSSIEEYLNGIDKEHGTEYAPTGIARAKFFKSSDGKTVLGWAKDGKIYLTKEGLNPNTPLHEFTHIYDSVMMDNNPELWNKGKELMKQTDVWNEVVNDENYSDIKDNEDEVASEVHARLVGKDGASLLQEMQKNALAENDLFTKAEKVSLVERLKQWIKNAYQWMVGKNPFAKSEWAADEIGRMTLDEFNALTMQELSRKGKMGINAYPEYTDDVRYSIDPEVRTRETARNKYEQRVKTGIYQAQEALQDSMLGLKEAMKAILKGGKDFMIENVKGFENAYLGENRMSSINLAESDAFEKLLFSPLLKEVARLAPNDMEREKLTDYMMAKHGLERNIVMATREAQDSYNKNLAKHPNTKKTYKDFFNKCREKDYGGLTGLTGNKDVSDAESMARTMVDEWEIKHTNTEVMNLWKMINDVNKASLQKSYDCGMMSKNEFDAVSNMYQYYIPLRGFNVDTSRDIYAYLSDRKSSVNPVVKKAKGRWSKADDPFSNMLSMAYSAISQGNRNKLVKQRFLNFVLNHPSDLASVSDLWLQYDKVNDVWHPVFPNNINVSDTAEEVEQKMADFENRMKTLENNDPDNYKHGEDAINIPYKMVDTLNLREHQIVVKRGGRDYVITINGNPRAAQAINGTTNPDSEKAGAIGAMVRMFEKFNRFLSGMATKYPNFTVSNFFRDALYSNSSAWIKETPNYALKFNMNFQKLNPANMRRLYHKYKHGELNMNDETEKLFQQFIMNGGETGFTNVRSIDKLKKDIDKEIKMANGKLKIERAWDFLSGQLEEMNRSVENCARFAAFMTSKQMGRSIDRAVYDAKEISVNFNKKGSGAKFLSAEGQTKMGNTAAFVSGFGRSQYIFWNASMQGMANYAKMTKRNPGKAISSAAAWFTLGATIAMLAAYGSGDDGDDENKSSYYNMPEYVRRSNLMFKLGDDNWITIPLPVEYRAIYGMGELMYSVMSGNERKDAGELALAMAGQLSQLLPIDFLEGGGGAMALMPSYARGITEAYVLNKSWTGMPIYKDTPYNQDLPEYNRVYKSANAQLVAVSKWLNEISGGDEYTKGSIDINPSKVEYMLKGIFSGAASSIDQLTKTGEMIVGKRDFDPNSVFVLNRLMKSGDERTQYRALSNEYFKAQKEHDSLKKRLKGYEDDTMNGVFDYADKIDFLYNSSGYERYLIYESYKDEINTLNDMMKDASDEEERQDIEKYLYEVKREMINEMDEARKGK